MLNRKKQKNKQKRHKRKLLNPGNRRHIYSLESQSKTKNQAQARQKNLSEDEAFPDKGHMPRTRTAKRKMGRMILQKWQKGKKSTNQPMRSGSSIKKYKNFDILIKKESQGTKQLDIQKKEKLATEDQPAAKIQTEKIKKPTKINKSRINQQLNPYKANKDNKSFKQMTKTGEENKHWGKSC